jgi:hypothetical protein
LGYSVIAVLLGAPPGSLLAALRHFGVALGYGIFEDAQDPVGRDPAIAGCRSVDPLAECPRHADRHARVARGSSRHVVDPPTAAANEQAPEVLRGEE